MSKPPKDDANYHLDVTQVIVQPDPRPRWQRVLVRAIEALIFVTLVVLAFAVFAAICVYAGNHYGTTGFMVTFLGMLVLGGVIVYALYEP